ncbi:MAG: 1-deoxy-D-xylulose-5-phosphate reductoisomerase [Bacteroidales bacterium]|nr:1-deoxy-D-xylulose-5-phosphate reductoisomerase [Bacteroidales bacterium]MDD2425160.1 1-deoxy-D-xylulose-5-phosphate reductoisomerase [Bacteroidales bacterium]MDD3989593.1 1-deoxy-D-xylulose-5-phosphate reductoisomerase [Bacteroidales bacterium]MDD4639490.1 1-deoxy-D-xylulose-5-phosphate reductoisomerase [Bacteroidales bacterium]
MKKKIAILGSTGSIGTQALDVISRHPSLFEVVLLTANSKADTLIQQSNRFRPGNVVIADQRFYEIVKAGLPSGSVLLSGENAVTTAVNESDADIVLTAMVGFSGLEPTIEAIKRGKSIALANKETLVAAGPIVMELAKKHKSSIVPVDSEHSAIFQCLQGECGEVEKLLLTASGGPFFGKKRDEIASASVEEALNHPKWNMGPKVSVDSATMMNKGLELIEASHLFDVEPERIEIVIHPQSIIHSMVQFTDGSVKAQMSNPDMRLPILYALSYPDRVPLDTPRLDFGSVGSLSFHKPDFENFPLLKTAYYAAGQGGNYPCAMNAANEIAVKSFLSHSISFGGISNIIDHVLSGTKFVAKPDIEEIYHTDKMARESALKYLKNKF